MSGSDQESLKDLEVKEEDVVETQGTVRYKQAANTQDPDDLSDFEDDELFMEIIPTIEPAPLPADVEAQPVIDIEGDIEEDYWEEGEESQQQQTEDGEEKPVLVRHRLPVRKKAAEPGSEEMKQSGGTIRHKISRTQEKDSPRTNLVVKLLEKNPLGMTLPEMAGGVRKQKRIKTLRPMLQAAIKEGLIMPVSQRAGHTVYKLVKNMR